MLHFNIQAQTFDVNAIAFSFSMETVEKEIRTKVLESGPVILFPIFFNENYKLVFNKIKTYTHTHTSQTGINLFYWNKEVLQLYYKFVKNEQMNVYMFINVNNMASSTYISLNWLVSFLRMRAANK